MLSPKVHPQNVASLYCILYMKLILQVYVTSPAQVNMVSIGTVAAEIQLASSDNVLATQVVATLFAPDGV